MVTCVENLIFMTGGLWPADTIITLRLSSFVQRYRGCSAPPPCEGDPRPAYPEISLAHARGISWRPRSHPSLAERCQGCWHKWPLGDGLCRRPFHRSLAPSRPRLVPLQTHHASVGTDRSRSATVLWLLALHPTPQHILRQREHEAAERLRPNLHVIEMVLGELVVQELDGRSSPFLPLLQGQVIAGHQLHQPVDRDFIPNPADQRIASERSQRLVASILVLQHGSHAVRQMVWIFDQVR